MKNTIISTNKHLPVDWKPAPTKDIHHIHRISIRYKKYIYLYIKRYREIECSGVFGVYGVYPRQAYVSSGKHMVFIGGYGNQFKNPVILYP